MRGVANVACEEPRLPPRRLDRAVAPEPPVESKDCEHEQHEQEAEEGERRPRVERADRGYDGVSGKGAAAAIVQLVLRTVRSIGAVRIQARVAGRGAIARIRTGVE